MSAASLREQDEMQAIYSEGEPIIWLRVERYKTARKAKHVAWSGDGIPWGFSEEYALLKDCVVSRVWMKSMGEQNGYDEWWQECSVTDVADCVEFFRIVVARAALGEDA